VIEILQQLGIQISPNAVLQSQAMLQQAQELMAMSNAAEKGPDGKPNTQHGGALAQQESLSKHHADQTGGMQGIGGTAAMAPGGMVQ
jgi:hypothetical protein